MNILIRALIHCCVVCVFAIQVSGAAAVGMKKLIIIAGKPSHGPREHEYRAGALLLQKCLAGTPGLLVEVDDLGWVKNEKDFDDADARWRDFSASLDGASVYGNLSLAKAGSLSYEFYGGMIDLAQDGGVARQIENGLLGNGLTLQRVNDCPQLGGQLWWTTPIQGLRLGASLTENIGFTYDAAQNTTYPVGGGQYTPLEVIYHGRLDVPWQHYSVEYQRKKWTFQAEWRTQTVIEKDTTSVEFSRIPSHDSTSVSRSASTSGSWYAGPAYEVNSWFQVGAYYNEFYANLNQLSSGPPTSYQKDLALSLRFDPKPWWILKVEGHFIRGTGLLYDNLENPHQSGNGWFMLALKTTFSF